MSDNGPQYSSEEMKDFAEKYNFQHITSSPHYPHAEQWFGRRNGQNCKEFIGKFGGPVHGTLELQSDTSTMVWAQPCTTLKEDGKTTENRHPPNKDYPNTGLADFR